tara:strand:+ start:109 stop:954 length:846 start_codon:yes stop_codon:yes gene_type:complete
MITVNSLSGGKTSSYIAANYPSNINVFSLVRTNDKNVLFPDAKVRQLVSDRIGHEFIGTLEMDDIIYTMLDLEQFIGKGINWLSPKTFEEVITMPKGKIYLPNKVKRICTVKMKIEVIAQWLHDINSTPCEMRIGFRANEMIRAKNMIERIEKDGFEHFKFNVGKSKNGRNKWQKKPYRKVRFPLIEDSIFKDKIEKYWQDKPVRFAYMNNCVGCFHRSPGLLKHMSDKAPKQFDWFIKQEIKANATFKTEVNYKQIKNSFKQTQLFDEDFNECDSGYCGL